MKIDKDNRPSFLLMFLLLFALTANSQSITSVGKDFWLAFNPNWNSSAPIVRIFISSDFSTNGSLNSLIPGVSQNFTVVPGVVTPIYLTSGVLLTGGIENKGIRITSADPITVYALNDESASTDAFLALPVSALGTDYRILTYTTAPYNSSRFSIVATEDNTVVTIFNHWTNSTTSYSLSQGQTFLSSGNPDVTGSRIQSNHPVAVFGTDDCVNVPGPSCQACDHLVEQMFPYYAWGKSFGTVPLAGRDNSGDIFRILSADDGNQITINGSMVATINTGDFYETNLAGYNLITASKPVMLAQFAKGIGCSGNITGDPFMMLIPPLEQFLKSYTFISLAPFASYVNVVAPDYALGTIYNDGVIIPASVFTRIGFTNYFGTQIPVINGTHNFTSINPFGVFAYGWLQANAYGYPGGCSISEVAKVKTLTLTPDTSYGQLNVTNVCLTAKAEDDQGNPVIGVLVTFHVSGLGPLTGNAYTDSLGNAQYCYTRTGSTPGTDHVYAEVSGITSNTVLVIWSVNPPCVNPTNGGMIGNAQSGCIGFIPAPFISQTSPTGETGILEYKWQFSITGNSSGFTDIPASNNATYSPGPHTQTTWYKRITRVSCMPDWAGAAESNVVEITVAATLAVSVGITVSANNICEGTPVVFNATPVHEGTNPNFQWMVNGLNIGSSAPVFTYTPVNGDKVVCVLTSSLNCVTNNPASSDTIDMIVLPKLPVSVLLSPSVNPVCFGDPVTITAIPTNGGTLPAYSWRVNGISQGSNAPVYSFIPAGGEIVICTMTSSDSCILNTSASDTLVIKVNKEKQIVDTTLCWGVPYFAGGQWQTSAGTYIDTLPAPVNCVMYIETHLHYKPYLPLDLGPDTNLCAGNVRLVVLIRNASYLWQDGSTDSIYTAQYPGEYYVQVIFEECKVSDTVLVSECPYHLIFPTAFTPNGDGLNDTFHPVGNEVPDYSMKVYNRWGQMIFETSSIEPGWDGTNKGQPCEPDTYVYIVTYKSLLGEKTQLKGYFVLSR